MLEGIWDNFASWALIKVQFPPSPVNKKQVGICLELCIP